MTVACNSMCDKKQTDTQGANVKNWGTVVYNMI